jgi:hypothetical protein
LPLRCDGEARPRPSTIEEAVGGKAKRAHRWDSRSSDDVVANGVLPTSTLQTPFHA